MPNNEKLIAAFFPSHNKRRQPCGLDFRPLVDDDRMVVVGTKKTDTTKSHAILLPYRSLSLRYNLESENAHAPWDARRLFAFDRKQDALQMFTKSNLDKQHLMIERVHITKTSLHTISFRSSAEDLNARREKRKQVTRAVPRGHRRVPLGLQDDSTRHFARRAKSGYFLPPSCWAWVR